MGDQTREERFRLLYDLGYPRIVAYALRRARTRDEAYTVVGDTFMTAWRRLDDLPAEEAWMSWLYGIARRVLANHYRSIDRQRRLQERLAAERAPAGPVTEDGPQVVRDALDRLKPDDREILTLAAWDGMSNSEIAAAVGLTPSAVAVRLHRAKKRLARELGRLGYQPEPDSPMQFPNGNRTPHGANGDDERSQEMPT